MCSPVPGPRKNDEPRGPDEPEQQPRAQNEAASSPALDRLNKALSRLNAKAAALIAALDSRDKSKN